MFNIVLSAILYQSYSTQCFLPPCSLHPPHLRLSKVRELLSIYLSIYTLFYLYPVAGSGLNPSLWFLYYLQSKPLSLSLPFLRTKFLKEHSFYSFLNLHWVNAKRLNTKSLSHSSTFVNTQKNKWSLLKLWLFKWKMFCAFSVIC